MHHSLAAHHAADNCEGEPMIRFIIKRHTVDLNEGSNNEDYYTIDADVPELEVCRTAA